MATPVLIREAPLGAAIRPAPPTWSVYVHFPFCLHRCAYCDFATIAATTIPRERTLAATLAELKTRTATLTPAPIATVFFGGGTPSLWGSFAIGAVLDALNRWGGFTPDAEITLEANPGAAEAGDLERYIDVGINRISLGVQALDDARLRALDRVHDAAAAHQTLRHLASFLMRGRLRSASADLIFGGPGQGFADLRADVDALLAYDLPHLSAYALTVEPDTPLAKMVARGAASEPDEGLQTTMLETLPAWLGEAGLRRYEVSNFARPGHESRHNLVYWQGGAYLALGVGAHGLLPGGAHGLGTRYGNQRSIPAWTEAALAGAAEGRLGEAFREEVTAAGHLDELLLTGLRLRVGVSLATIRGRLGSAVADAVKKAALQLAADGRALVVIDDHVRVDDAAVAGLDGIVLALSTAAEALLAPAQATGESGGVRPPLV